MSENLQQLTNNELKAYIKANRNNESDFHEALKILMARQASTSPQYSYDLPPEEMEAIFREKLQSLG